MHSAFPLLRFDQRLPRKWFHKYQHIYMWAAFPLLTMGFHVSGLCLWLVMWASLWGARIICTMGLWL